MFAVRLAALTALVVWLGGLFALWLLVAPIAPADEFPEILRRFHRLAYACGGTLIASLVVMKLVGPPPRGFIPRLVIAATMSAVTVYSGLRMVRELSVLMLTTDLVLGVVLLLWYVREP
jgi:hypothetical protein